MPHTPGESPQPSASGQGISVLGESLLARASKRNQRNFEKQRREAWKIALMQGGVSLINSTLAKKADIFMQNESIMAAKGKYRASSQQANTIIGMQTAAADAGQTMEEYFFENRYLPSVTAEFAAQYGTEFTPESYSPQIRAKALELSRGEAVEFKEALRIAQEMPTLDETMANINTLVDPPRNAGRALLDRVGNVFSGRTAGDVQEEILQRVTDESLIKNQSAEIAFNKILNDEGASAAVDFVKGLDTTGFDANDKVVITTQVATSNDGSVFFIQNAQITDHRGNVSQKEGYPKHDQIHISTENKDRIAGQLLQSIDLFSIGNETLNTQGFSLYVSELDKAGINQANIRNGRNFERAAQIYNIYANNPAWVKDTRQDEISAVAVSAILTAMPNKLAELEASDDPEAMTQFVQDIGILVNELSRVVTSDRSGIFDFSEILRDLNRTEEGFLQNNPSNVVQ